MSWSRVWILPYCFIHPHLSSLFKIHICLAFTNLVISPSLLSYLHDLSPPKCFDAYYYLFFFVINASHLVIHFCKSDVSVFNFGTYLCMVYFLETDYTLDKVHCLSVSGVPHPLPFSLKVCMVTLCFGPQRMNGNIVTYHAWHKRQLRNFELK